MRNMETRAEQLENEDTQIKNSICDLTEITNRKFKDQEKKA